MQKFSKFLLGIATAGAIATVPFSQNYEKTNSNMLQDAKQTQVNLKQTIKEKENDKTIKQVNTDVSESTKNIMEKGNLIADVVPTIVKQVYQNPNHYQTNKDYQHALGIMKQYIDNSPSWNPCSTPWTNNSDLKCTFIFGTLNTYSQRQVAWVFTNDQNQPVVVVTGAWDGQRFTNMQLYQTNAKDDKTNSQFKNKVANQISKSSSSRSSSASSNSAGSSSDTNLVSSSINVSSERGGH